VKKKLPEGEKKKQKKRSFGSEGRKSLVGVPGTLLTGSHKSRKKITIPDS
jgi:hypothetical protein